MLAASAVSAGGGGSTYATEVLADSPFAYWRLGEASGTTAVDEQGGHDGTYAGSPTFGATALVKGDDATTFDGSDDRVDVGTLGTFGSQASTNGFTIELWLRWSGGGENHVFGYITSTDLIQVSHGYHQGGGSHSSDGVISCQVRGSEGNLKGRITAGTQYNDGLWHHVVVTWAGGAVDPDIYVDGSLDNGAAVGNGLGVTLSDLPYAAQIACRNNVGTPEDFFAGDVDEVAIFTSALSVARVEAHWAAAFNDYTAPALPATRTFDTVAYDGLVDFCGSDDEAHPYVNPAVGDVAYPVTVSQSSDLSAASTADKALDQNLNYSHTTNATSSEWWKVDFGDRRIEVDHYGIQGRASGGQHPRNWKLQGSNDDSTWTDIDTQSSNSSIGDGTWFDGSVSDTTSWRYLRIIMTGTNSSGEDYLVMGEVEFWGTLESAP